MSTSERAHSEIKIRILKKMLNRSYQSAWHKHYASPNVKVNHEIVTSKGHFFKKIYWITWTVKSLFFFLNKWILRCSEINFVRIISNRTCWKKCWIFINLDHQLVAVKEKTVAINPLFKEDNREKNVINWNGSHFLLIEIWKSLKKTDFICFTDFSMLISSSMRKWFDQFV